MAKCNLDGIGFRWKGYRLSECNCACYWGRVTGGKWDPGRTQIIVARVASSFTVSIKVYWITFDFFSTDSNDKYVTVKLWMTLKGISSTANFPSWKMSPHYLVKRTTFSSDWRYVAFLQTLVALKKVSFELALVALKRTSCDVRQIECQTSNVTANCSKWPLSARIDLHASSLFADWYSIRMKNEKVKKIVHFPR